jgi:opacity protein-like surface antigen
MTLSRKRPFRRAARSLALAVVSLGTAASAGAQGSVGVQGLGFPPGQLGTRAASMGGGNGEHDPESSVNPAALGLAPNTMIFFQYAPEFRSVSTGGTSDRTTTLRFPLIGGYARLGERARIGLAVSTLLDRTFSVAVQDTSSLAGGGSIVSTDRFRNEGGMSDVRFAGSWRVARRVDVGVGVHAITGQNRIDVTRSVGDSLELSLESRTLSFSGGALSTGVALQLSSVLNVAASLQRGLDLRARSGDTLMARARVPDRFGAGIQYAGITGTTLAARMEYMSWSNVRGLVSDATPVDDTWEIGAGADVAGPKLGTRPLLLRAGVRWRELPFGITSADRTTELELGGGVGFQLPFERAMAEIGIRRASRSAGSAKETGWTLGLGVSVRP